MYDREALKQLVREKALKFGDFTLASVKKATYYLDCRQITLDSQGARLVGEGMLELLSANMPQLVGGMAIGADPITAAILIPRFTTASRSSSTVASMDALQNSVM